LSTGKTQAVDSFAEYQEIPGVNWSTLKSLRVSPKQYQYDIHVEREDAAHFRIGRACHAWVLEHETFEERFVCYRDGVRRGARWENFKVDHAGKEILNPTEWMKAIGTATAICTHPVASQYLSGLAETVVTWTDQKTRIDCKARLDLVNGKLIEIKSTSSLAPRMFAAQVARLGYHGQLAFYDDGSRAAGIDVEPDPLIIAAESSPPHDVAVYRLTQEAITRGREDYVELLKLLKRCTDDKHWPGLADDAIVDLDLPAWCYLGDEQDVFVIGGDKVTL
jgi:hypothetical protein